MSGAINFVFKELNRRISKPKVPLQYSAKLLNFLNVIRMMAFHFNWDSSFSTGLIDSSRKSFVHYFMASTCLVQASIAVFQLVRYLKYYTVNSLDDQLVPHLILLLAYALTLLFHAHLLYYREMIQISYNKMAILVKNIERTFKTTNYEKTFRTTDKIMVFIAISIGQIVLLYVVYSMNFHYQKIWFGAFILPHIPENSTKLYAFLFAVIDGTINISAGVVWVTQTYFLLIFFQSTQISVSLLLTEKSNVRMDKKLRMYREIKLATSLYNEVFGEKLLPLFMLLFGSYSGISVYGFIKIFHNGHPAMIGFLLLAACFSIIVQLLYYPIGGSTYHISLQVLQSLYVQNSNNNEQMGVKNKENSVIKSLGPISININSCFRLRKITSLEFMSIVINYTIMFLIG